MNGVSSEMIGLNVDRAYWKCHPNASGFMSMCFLALCRNRREKEWEDFKKERERESGREIEQSFFQNRD